MNPESSTPEPTAEQARERELRAAARRRVRTPLWNLLLLVPLLLTLFPGLYNKSSPELFDIPFFYWWQFLCIPIGVLCVVVVFRATRGER